MKRRIFSSSIVAAIILMVAVPTSLQAHVGVVSSVPAENSVVDTQPGSFQIVFTRAVRVTSLEIVQLSDEVVEDLEFSPVRQFAMKVTGALPAHSPGQYEIRWRALSKDMHVMTGKIHFTINKPNSAPTTGQ